MLTPDRIFSNVRFSRNICIFTRRKGKGRINYRWNYCSEGGYVLFNLKIKAARIWGITEAHGASTWICWRYAGITTHAEATRFEESYWIKGFDVIRRYRGPVFFELCDAAVSIGAYRSAWLAALVEHVFNHGKRYRIFVVADESVLLLAADAAALERIIWLAGGEGAVLVKALNCSRAYCFKRC